MKKTLAVICAFFICLPLMFGSAQAADLKPPGSAAPAQTAPIVRRAASEAQAVAQAELANLNAFTGTVEVESDGQTMAAYEGMRLYAGDFLRTGPNSTASLDLDQGRLLMLDADGELQLTETPNGSLEIYLNKGTILNDISKGQTEPYSVRAANVTMGVLGTVFRVSIDNVSGIAVTELYEGQLLITFTTSDGEEHSFMLNPGSRLTCDEETLDDSARQNGLLTDEIYLDDLSDNLLNMLQDALQAREDAEGITELLEQINAMKLERNAKPNVATVQVPVLGIVPGIVPDEPIHIPVTDPDPEPDPDPVTTAPAAVDITPVSAEKAAPDSEHPTGLWALTVSWAAVTESIDGYAGYILTNAQTWLKQFSVSTSETQHAFDLDVLTNIAVVADPAGETLADEYDSDKIEGGSVVQDLSSDVSIAYVVVYSDDAIGVSAWLADRPPSSEMPTYTCTPDESTPEKTLELSPTEPETADRIEQPPSEPLVFTPDQSAVLNEETGTIELYDSVTAQAAYEG